VTRWKELHNGGAELVQAGDLAGAQEAFEAACLEARSDEERASTLVNLSAVVDMGGDPFRAAELLTEAIELATPMLGVALATRADIYMRLGQWDEAWQDLDDAHADAEFIPEEFLRAVTAGMHASWAAALVWTGQFGEAAAAAKKALDLAYQDSPQLAPAVHRTLAEIAGSTGDLAGSVEHHSLALELCTALNDEAGAALSTLSLARLAYLSSDNDRAETLYDEAEQLFLAVGEERGRAICAHGRAGVKISRGQAREALELLDQVVDVLDELPTERVAVYQVQGAALETLGDYAQADERYAAAMTASEQAELWHVAIGIAWWRADALVRWASTVSGEQRRELSRRALDLALPAALAAEAVRQRFAHGPLRERWVALATAPATRSAFEAISAVEDVQLAAEYIDHIAGTVSLQAGPALVRDELLSFPTPPPAPETELPYAASFFATTGTDPEFPSSGFSLPPRVRVDPAVPSTLDRWIDVAEQRYGFPVRSAQTVASW
jgi:tetratricopeptide (TPR) repeat protein